MSFVVEKPSWLLNEQHLLANLIHVSIEGAAALYTVKGSTLFKFFEKIFKDIRYVFHDNNQVSTCITVTIVSGM